METARQLLISNYHAANVRNIKHILAVRHTPGKVCPLEEKLSRSSKDVRKSRTSDNSFVTVASNLSCTDRSPVTSEDMKLAKNVFDERQRIYTAELDKYGTPRDTTDADHKVDDSKTDSSLPLENNKKSQSEPVIESLEKTVELGARERKSSSEPSLVSEERKVDSTKDVKLFISDTTVDKKDDDLVADYRKNKNIPSSSKNKLSNHKLNSKSSLNKKEIKTNKNRVDNIKKQNDSKKKK
ncbi:hypothetical protein NPIL_23101 [Nephila pilipes]|nr:hypothetical protein NPIL_167171 [Nephila pilipes]GFT98685.1 hypothetical protein NPIL_23101 [Nephila pilipes]